MKLRMRLLNAAKNGDALIGAKNEFGQRYVIDFEMEHEGKTAQIRSAWIIETDLETPRFITCYVI